MGIREPGGSVRPVQAAMLERLCFALDRAGEQRALIRLAECWSVLGRLPAKVALVEAGNLLDFGLVDRAWVRMRECEDALGDTVEHSALQAEMYLQRGWPARARRHLESALEAHPETPALLRLLERTDAPAMEPPSDARDVEREGNPEQLVDLAERFLRTGSHLRARAVLERLRKKEGPLGGRVEDLLWGLDGGFEEDDVDLMVLAESLLPRVALLEVEGGAETMTQTRVGPVLVDMVDPPLEADGPAFPSLFRWLEEEAADPGSAEVTAVSSLAEMLVSEEHTQNEDDTGTQQTRIMRLIFRKERTQDVTSDVSEPVEHADLSEALPPAALEIEDSGVFDSRLDEMQASGGMELTGDVMLLETEDADRVVMTRRESEPTDPSVADVLSPIEVIPQRIGPKREKVEVTQPIHVEDETGERTAKLEAPSSDLAEVETPLLDETVLARAPDLDPAGTQRLVWLTLVVLLVGGFGVLGGSRMISMRAVTRVVGDAQSVLNEARYAQILQQEAQLDLGILEERSPLAARHVSRALVELALWGEYSGGKLRLASATESLQLAASLGGGGPALGLANAWRSFYLGDLPRAQQDLSVLPENAERLYLESRIAAVAGREGAAGSLASRAVTLAPGSMRNLLWRARLCTRSGDDSCARLSLEAAAGIDPRHPELELLEIYALSSNATPSEQIARFEGYLASHAQLAPRLAGSVELHLAAMYEARGEDRISRESITRALAHDPENPDARYLSGVERYQENRLKAAAADFQACRSSRPSDARCLAGLLRVLLEQDRVAAAREALQEGRRTVFDRPGLDCMEGWVQLAEGDLDAALLVLLLDRMEEPEPAWLVGVMRGTSGDPGAAEALVRSLAGLAESADPMLQGLTGRVKAQVALYGVELENREKWAEDAVVESPIDPMVRVARGRYLESLGRGEEAAVELDLAVNLGPETALAHYERGLFYLDFGDKHERTLHSWHRYRQLLPTGPRAKQVEKRLLALQ
jgi:tetratricopeptide (TPR) repeat protein